MVQLGDKFGVFFSKEWEEIIGIEIKSSKKIKRRAEISSFSEIRGLYRSKG
ncbi:hypothetical protein [Paenibacillus larvae]|uniref:hypothetical protein n=1 Tax=Paenibacillus larvae TaxID=1464 RepID=UPI002282AD96|nr:hypothetical protein [Paenibacillus larvae]MCY9750295.1 hypothetical protein [Paenibacillus larvae]MCY9774396.1 hypothetical protein [Paenibacillus larvae]MEC0186580.1 hypothetical protein [Paenibacillus larvae]